MLLGSPISERKLSSKLPGKGCERRSQQEVRAQSLTSHLYLFLKWKLYELHQIGELARTAVDETLTNFWPRCWELCDKNLANLLNNLIQDFKKIKIFQGFSQVTSGGQMPHLDHSYFKILLKILIYDHFLHSWKRCYLLCYVSVVTRVYSKFGQGWILWKFSEFIRRRAKTIYSEISETVLSKSSTPIIGALNLSTYISDMYLTCLLDLYILSHPL